MNTATRRRGGVFLTPLPFAEKAIEYLDKTLGKQRLLSGEYRLWDMAAGTGHLELFLPKETQQYCYLSTLEQKDVHRLKKEFPSATVFQYNYLEDDVEQLPSQVGCRPPDAEVGDNRLRTSENNILLASSTKYCKQPPSDQLPNFPVKLPDALRNDLANPKIKWIILVNPPYATAQEAGLQGKSKEGVSNTKIRKQMHAEGLGEVSRELYVQFLYRIMNEFKHRKTILGLFSPLKYLISANYQKFRDRLFKAIFQSGFVFSSENFGGTSKTSHFPVSFILWDIDQNKNITGQEIQLDILDHTAQKIGTKTVKPTNRNDFLSRWIKRPRGTKIFPPFSSALTIKLGNVDTRNRIAEGFLASLMCPGNELQNQQQTAFLSGPQVSAGALSVTPDNFEQAVVVFSVRRIPKDSWIDHVDQLMRPNRELSPQFIGDCAVWSLFDSKNQTVSLKNVIYQGQFYQVVNHFFPFTVADILFFVYTEAQRSVKTISCPSCFCEKQKENSFVADWLSQQTLSEEAQTVLDSAREIYRLYFANFAGPYDAGWYQIQKALLDAKLGIDLLANLKRQHSKLKEKILPLLYNYELLRENRD